MLLFLQLLLIWLPSCAADQVVHDLLRNAWTFRNRSNDPSLAAIHGPAAVPGDIYADLQALKLIDDPLFADNDVKLRWVARENWTYSTTFDVEPELLQKPSQLMIFDGLDTIANVQLNGKQILITDNQFVQYTADVTGKLLASKNRLEIHFESPVAYADRAAREYFDKHHHGVPPECTPEIYHGECHANFIRKIQAQFAWDWGPAFPTVGIFKGARIIANDGLHLESVHVDTVFNDDKSVTLNVHADVRSTETVKIHWDLTLPELNHRHNSITVVKKGSHFVSAQLQLKKRQYELWWPNWMGPQKLYTLSLKLTRQDKKAFATKSIRFGIRRVELIQDYIDSKNASLGRNFYFKVNNQPVFLKGSNWIPVSPFPARNNTDRMEFLLESARTVGMNAMRVWGGGRYETEEFYDLADEKGVLLWHDMMFACSLYPTDPNFLRSVKTEIEQNVKWIKNHPSVLVWAGNNENELGIADGWWGDLAYTDKDRIADYAKLYKDLIGNIIAEIDPIRPYLMSSPSNGFESEKVGGVSAHPGDPRYGDIHYYNEYANLWRDSSYQTPRCATEYGLQSLPSLKTMSNYLSPEDLSFLSRNYTHRQHHPGGLEAFVTLVFSHFPLPKECSLLRGKYGEVTKSSVNCLGNVAAFLERFTYFTQFNQALTYKTETEHYLRFRGRLDDEGYGNTMCALYWQLNDVWAAPTWSSIDWDLRWKPAHYEARRFFSPQFVIIYLNDNDVLEVFAINDKPETATDVTVLVQVFSFENGNTPVFRFETKLDLPPYSSTPINITSLNAEWKSSNDVTLESFVFTAEWLNLTKQRVGYQSTVIADKLWKVDLEKTGTVQVDGDLVPVNELQYKFTLNATGIAPLVWMEVIDPGIIATFSDNAFTMTDNSTEITLTLKQKIDRTLTKQDLYVCSLKDCYVKQ